jgi:alpha-L-fucosidase
MFNILRRTILQDLPVPIWHRGLEYSTKPLILKNHVSTTVFSPVNRMHSKGLQVRAIFFVVVMVMAGVATAQTVDRRAWWRAARFGMFIHWGPASLTGQEISWSRANSNSNCPNNGPIPVSVYDNLYKRFDPTNFDAGEWVRTAKSAGMKYMVLTAKHGDGFLLWNSKVDGYNIGATPFQRDVCAELAAAAQAQDEPLGWYFSPMDWRDPDCRSANNDRFVAKIQGELRELLSHYGKICLLWFDTDGRPTMWHPAETYALVRGLQPQILINNRLEMSTSEQWLHQGKLRPNEDYYTPEQRIGTYDDRTPWETCMTLGTQWAWKPNDSIKTAAEVERILAQCVGGDGNLLLDVGPRPDGRMEPRQVDVLEQVGSWLAKNGESIYGTRGGPWKPTKALASTRAGNIIYLHVLQAKGATVELPGIACRIQSASLSGGGDVGVKQAGGEIILSLPPAGREAGDTVVKLTLDGSAMDLPAGEIPADFKATTSSVYQDDGGEYGPQRAFDGDPQTRWAAATDATQAWIAVDLKKPRSINGVRIDEAYAGRVREFQFQCRAGGEWKTIFAGTKLGAHFEKSFTAVQAREFRLNILTATAGPTINEIELLPE